MDYLALGKRIRKRRVEQGMTQEQLARQVGVTTSFIGHLERGSRKASLETLVALANALQKAEFVAKTNGMKLGALRSLKEEEPVFGHAIRSETDELMDSTIVSATVEMVWELVK